MPLVSVFDGISIRLYMLDNQHHRLPHFHARYAEFEASISIVDGSVLAGKLPLRQLHIVKKWLNVRRSEIEHGWTLAVTGNLPPRIEPL